MSGEEIEGEYYNNQYVQAEMTSPTVRWYKVPLLPSPLSVRYKCFDDIFDSPACSTCQALDKECEYKTEAGESRWAALNRKNDTLETERDGVRGLLTLIRTLPEPEAQVIFHRIRLSTDSMDLGLLIQQIRDDVDSWVCTEQSKRHLQHQLPYVSMHPEATSPIPYLPPLRSVVEIPRAEAPTTPDEPPVATFEDA